MTHQRRMALPTHEGDTSTSQTSKSRGLVSYIYGWLIIVERRRMNENGCFGFDLRFNGFSLLINEIHIYLVSTQVMTEFHGNYRMNLSF